MRYIVRALKYFVQVFLIFTVILAVLMLAGAISTDINTVFTGGWKSVGWIAVMFAAVSLLYPRFGYAGRGLALPGEYRELKPGIAEYMQARGYVAEHEEDENLSFRLASGFGRLSRMYEDRITFTRELGGFRVEGPNKDVVRIISGLSMKFRNND